ncbi:MAG: ATP-binding protein [Thermoanaerobaculia bacterium]
MDPKPPRRRSLGLEGRSGALAMALALPATAAAGALLWIGDHGSLVRWSATALLAALWILLGLALRAQVVRPLRTLANLLETLRTGDYSIRARAGHETGALGAIHGELHQLAGRLQEQRLGALEAAALVRKMMAEIDLAVFTFDPGGRMRQVNRAGERLLGQDAERLLGQRAERLGLADLLEGPARRTVERSFAGAGGRWEVRRGRFREGGAPHHLLVVADLSKALREEERLAWQRLIRVLGHELNNSLTPIQSMASTLRELVPEEPADETREDLRRGLEVIEQRSRAVSRFVASYARLARLPPPRFEPVSLSSLVRDVTALEDRLEARLVPGPEIVVEADRGQLEQLLINLLGNAVDAVSAAGGEVTVAWRLDGGRAILEVADDGPGLPESANLFVPFFTTKPGGSGIGLVLCRQIADAHDAELRVENRPGTSGCIATLILPLDVASRRE